MRWILVAPDVFVYGNVLVSFLHSSEVAESYLSASFFLQILRLGPENDSLPGRRGCLQPN